MSIGCGGDHTCALDKEGQAWCWGGSNKMEASLWKHSRSVTA